MRKSADWMTIWDDRILEIIREEGPMSPTPLSNHDYIRIGKSGVSKRLNRMKDHGLVQELGNGVYSITEKGVSYLDGEIDASDLVEEETENGDTAQAGS
ncbi:winged helix-turn-helix domain-containing protein [Haloparvum sedimenti]|uniref:winged helix-turn-helix domain-containing protein n=1 Tax=Haloparvum sedimenti TaxID=1678448 RepID=UPI00071E907F|nr:winged helix-turn-helix domain-containing protein [Haloparvum sedimenti]